MEKKMYLQPLRITSGWEITINNFFDEEATQKIKNYFSPSIILAGKHNASKEEFVVESLCKNNDTWLYILTIRKIKYDKNQKRKYSEIIHTMETAVRKELIEAIDNYMVHGYKSIN